MFSNCCTCCVRSLHPAACAWFLPGAAAPSSSSPPPAVSSPPPPTRPCQQAGEKSHGQRGQGVQDIQVCRSRSPEYPGTEVKESRISRYGGQGVQDTQVWRSRSPGYPGMVVKDSRISRYGGQGV